MYNIKCTKEILNQKVIKLFNFQFHFIIIFNYINCNIHVINNMQYKITIFNYLLLFNYLLIIIKVFLLLLIILIKNIKNMFIYIY